MVYDLKFMMLCWIKWLQNEPPILQPQGLQCGYEMGRSYFKMGRVAKWVGTATLHSYFGTKVNKIMHLIPNNL